MYVIIAVVQKTFPVIIHFLYPILSNTLCLNNRFATCFLGNIFSPLHSFCTIIGKSSFKESDICAYGLLLTLLIKYDRNVPV